MAAPEELPSDQRAAAIGERFQELSDECEAILLAAITGAAVASIVGLTRERAKIAAAVQTFQAKTLPVTAEVIRQAYLDSAAETVQTLTRMGVSDALGNGPNDDLVLRILMENATSKLGEASVTVGRRAEDGLRKAALEQISEGTARGDSVAQTTKRLTADLEQRGLVGNANNNAKLVRVNGRNYQANKYAEMVVRTTAREAHSEAVKQRLQENNMDLVEVSRHTDTDGPDICNDYEGKVFSLTGETDGYPVLPFSPPFHPNCRHVLLPGPIAGLS